MNWLCRIGIHKWTDPLYVSIGIQFGGEEYTLYICKRCKEIKRIYYIA